MTDKCENMMPNTPMMYEEVSLIINSERLWLQLVNWMRSLIISTLRDPKQQPAVLNRLYIGVTRDFYNYFKLLYGSEIAQQIINIMSGTIINVLNLVGGIKTNDTGMINTNTIQLYQRADTFSAYLHKINDSWDENQWRSFLYQYIKLLIEQIMAISAEDFEAEISIAGKTEELATTMGNYMAKGVLNKLSRQQQPAPERLW